MEDTLEEETGTTRVVHFNLEGQFLADLARTRVEEGAWDHALKMLVDSLEGLTHEQAVAILRGRADLTGWSNDAEGISYEVLPDDGPLAQRMDKRMDYMYGSVFKHGDSYWKPYAEVGSWGPDDYMFARQRRGKRNIVDGTVRSRSSRYQPALDYRSLYYANEPQGDLLVCVQYTDLSQREVLCERVDLPPLWVKVSVNEPAEHLRRRLKAGLRLEQRGYSVDNYESGDTDVQAKAEEGAEPEEPKAPSAQAAAPEDVATDGTVAETGEAADDALASEEATEVSVKDAVARVLAFKKVNQLFATYTQRVADASSREELRQVERDFEAAFATIEHPEAQDAFSEVRHRLLDEVHTRRMQEIGAEVARQADREGGWLELPLVKDGAPYEPKLTLRVPRNPFLLWALKGFLFEANGKERPKWSIVSPSGLKMYNDDPLHTDWMLGAGVSIDDTYSNDEHSLQSIVRSSSFDLRMTLVEEWSKAQFVTLARGTERSFHGTVAFPAPNGTVEPGQIAVVPTAGPEYQAAMLSANKRDEFGRPGLIICNTGGKLAHLATVGREFSCTVLMVPKATERFREGQLLHIDMEEGTLKVSIL